MKRNVQNVRIHPEHAAHALNLLIAEGKIAPKDVASALKRREALIAELKQRLASLEGKGMAKDGPFPKKTARGQARLKAKRKLSAARRSALQLHGQYLGAVRKLSKPSRAKIKAIRRKSGVKAAVAAAKRMAS